MIRPGRRRLHTRQISLPMGAACLCLNWSTPTFAQEENVDPYEILDQMGEALHLIEEEYFEPADQTELLDGALRGMVAGLDPHSSYLNRSDRKIFEGNTSGQFGGIGVEVEFTDGDVLVIAPVEGSPADRAGIVAGDKIVALDGRPLLGEKPQQLVRMMRGKIGVPLRLTLQNPATHQLRDVTVVRENIKVASVRARLLLGDIGYFRIKAFQSGTHHEFLALLGQMRDESPNLSGIILDLRNNPGGLVREATAMADEFLNEGGIYSTRHRGRILKSPRAHSGGAWSKGSLVVLINEYSASAAELVAGALRDHGRAQLVGAPSFGKGSVQTVLNLGHGGALKLTTALYFTPKGHTVQANGIVPHVLVDPGYKNGTTMRVLKERDLPGHLLESAKKTSPVQERGSPPTNKELHLGVAREIPRNPLGGPDLALEVAYKIVRGELKPASSLLQYKEDSGGDALPPTELSLDESRLAPPQRAHRQE